MAWPSPRFTDNGHSTVTDNLTGLMCVKDAECLDSGKWQDALNSVSDFNVDPNSFSCLEYAGGYMDWRLHDTKEFMSLIDRSKDIAAGIPVCPFDQPFSGAVSHIYWSSTVDLTFFTPNRPWIFYTGSGSIFGYSKWTFDHYAWAVGGGQKCKGHLDGNGDVDGTDLFIVEKDLGRTNC